MIDREITETGNALGRASGHYTWKWDGHNAFRTEGLNEELAKIIVDDITALGSRVSRQTIDGAIVLTISHDDAQAFIINEGRDRAHAAPAPSDHLLDYLQKAHPAFVWQKTQSGPNGSGYTGSGYDLKQHSTLTEPFLREGIIPRSTDVETNHDGPTHGIFIPTNAVARLVQQQQIAKA